MSLGANILGQSEWHLPSPSATPKSTRFPDAVPRTPGTEVVTHSHFVDAWSTPHVNGQQTPVQTPSFTLSTPVERPSTAAGATLHTPDDLDFHVNHFAPSNLPLPPVHPSRRLSSSPVPGRSSATSASVSLARPSMISESAGMDPSQMHTPSPVRHLSARPYVQHGQGSDFATPATVVATAATPGTMPPSAGLFHQTPFGFLQSSSDASHFPPSGPMSAPVLPQSRLFWDHPPDSGEMDIDPSASQGPLDLGPHDLAEPPHWQSDGHMNAQAFFALQGLSSPGPPLPSDAKGRAMATDAFGATSAAVDPSLLFSFSSPGPRPTHRAAAAMQAETRQPGDRQPYGQQLRDSMREKDLARRARAQHSRTSTSSSAASFEFSGLQRSNTDSRLGKARPLSMDSRSLGSMAGATMQRRSSPLKRQSGGSLLSIPEVRRQRTCLIVDDHGHARTETLPLGEGTHASSARREDLRNPRQQYPGLWSDDDSESEAEDPVSLSRNTSFTQPPRRSSKHARIENGDVAVSNFAKVAKSGSRPLSSAFDTSSFETMRPVRQTGDNTNRRFSTMDLPDTIVSSLREPTGTALGALKQVVGDRQKRSDALIRNTLEAHNQRWAHAATQMTSADASTYIHSGPALNASPLGTGLTTPSTDRSSSGGGTRCVCSGTDDKRPMVQCESCYKWLHMACVGLHDGNIPPVYVCIFCTGATPVARGGRVRGPLPDTFESPLGHKSVNR